MTDDPVTYALDALARLEASQQGIPLDRARQTVEADLDARAQQRLEADTEDWPMADLMRPDRSADFDRVVRAVAGARDGDYFQALEQLLDRYDTVHRASREPRNVTLGQVLPADVTLAKVVSGTRTLAQAEAAQATLERTIDVFADDAGQVRLAKAADRGRLLTDPAVIETKLLEARELTATLPEDVAPGSGVPASPYDGSEGRQRFETDWRASVERGVDMLATIRLEQAQGTQEADRRTEDTRQYVRDLHARPPLKDPRVVKVEPPRVREPGTRRVS